VISRYEPPRTREQRQCNQAPDGASVYVPMTAAQAEREFFERQRACILSRHAVVVRAASMWVRHAS
jgi:hypothetical protein